MRGKGEWRRNNSDFRDKFAEMFKSGDWTQHRKFPKSVERNNVNSKFSLNYNLFIWMCQVKEIIRV